MPGDLRYNGTELDPTDSGHGVTSVLEPRTLSTRFGVNPEQLRIIGFRLLDIACQLCHSTSAEAPMQNSVGKGIVGGDEGR